MSLFDLAVPEGDAVCGTSLALSGAVSNHCYWSFPYRSAASVQSFDAMVQRVANCASVDGRLYGGDMVNHPDTYDLRRFMVAGNIVNVSLKDKASLQKTIVFLRISGTP